jgi:hypothetical protein
MARPIKRLADRADQFGPRIREDDPRLRWWTNLGINTGALLLDLQGASIERRSYEKQLRSRTDPDGAAEIRTAMRTLKRAAPLIRLLKTEPDDEVGGELFFGDLGETIECAVKNYLDRRHPKIPAHRPGDPWLRKPVISLARVLHAHRVSRRRSIREIHKLLVLAGHSDVATQHKIRHIIRGARPLIDSELPPRLAQWWFTQPSTKRSPVRRRS